MKLVETDIPHGDEEVSEAPRPPRPERRRVYVSLALTLSVLVATVTAVYVAFPKRDNELLTEAIDTHRAGGELDLERPSTGELKAWTVGAVGEMVPWPEPTAEVTLLGTRRIRVLKRPVAVVLYRVGKDEVTYMAMRARDAPPRKYRREDDGDLAVSWRRGPWTLVAVGPAATQAQWRKGLDVP